MTEAAALRLGNVGSNGCVERLRSKVLENNGGQPIRLSPEEYQRLNELRKKIDPDVLKRIDVLADVE